MVIPIESNNDVKYGLSVGGEVHPKHIYSNNTGQPSDVYTDQRESWACVQRKPCRGAPLGAIEDAVSSMTTLNRAASRSVTASKRTCMHRCAGFGFFRTSERDAK